MRRFASRIASMSAFLLLLSCAASQPHWKDALEYQSAELSRLEIGKYGLPYVTVKINNLPANFAFDTGNMSGLLISTRTANDFGLTVLGRARLFDSDGHELPAVREHAVKELEIFGRKLPNQRALEDTRDDVSGYVGPKYVMPGRFTLDYHSGWIGVSRRPIRRPSQSAEPLLASERFPGMIVISGEANGVPVLLQLDTGKSRTCIDPALARRLQLPSDNKGVRGLTIRLGSLTFPIRAAKETGFSGISSGYPSPILVGVGSDILSQVILTVDYGTRLVSVDPPSASDGSGVVGSTPGRTCRELAVSQRTERIENNSAFGVAHV